MGKWLYKRIKYLLSSLLEIIYTEDRVCFICESHIEEAFPICDNCNSYLPYLDKSVLEYNTILKNTYSIFEFQGKIKEMVYGLKYNKEVDKAKIIGDIMARFIEKEDISIDIIIPIPMHRDKLLERGYNHSLLIAKRIGSVTGIPVETSLEKVKNTPNQVLLSGEERWYNVRGSLKCNTLYKNKNILLIDDVVTTCATAHFAALEIGEDNNVSLLSFATTKKF
ncbi:ComF family protein [Clostridium cylindrosporum]|uniref:Phosphoribosyltransferase n=1 Tax=Clostridium cylindrosporum DSM 605 TaxID=1121307 RepID=A0A0J8G722_CLOCY|nr:ComF family protein [Clostridium cylindrosporum]KMT23381.1 phosphoribosyltransferase [Clostridium cylindrosporum DSM 605]